MVPSQWWKGIVRAAYGVGDAARAALGARRAELFGV
jgi:hypothetical protein